MNSNIKFLENAISKKEKELNIINKNINIKNTNNNLDNNIIQLFFNSMDQSIKEYPISCLSTDYFAEIEIKLYEKYNKYKEKDKDVFFICNGSTMQRFKTIFENNLKSGNKIILYMKPPQ